MLNDLLIRPIPKPLLFVAVLTAAVVACTPVANLINLRMNEPTPTFIPTEAPTEKLIDPEGTVESDNDGQDSSVDADTGWLRFHDESFGLSFQYPPDWIGPEVYSWEDGVQVEVGTDTVYPYGTGLDERIYEKKDTYFITIQYTQNSQGWAFDEFVEKQPWMQNFVELNGLSDGESITTPRSLTIRQRAVEVGEFSGIEYIGTLSETAQTMIFYSREVLLFDDELNHLRVTGGPNNVEIPENGDWRAAYQQVDAKHREIFYQILESVSLE